MKALTGWLYSWCERELMSLHKTGYTGVSILCRVWTEGNVSFPDKCSIPLISDYHTSDDAILENALARLPNRQHDCVILKHCQARKDDGTQWTTREYAHYLGVSKSSFDTHVARGKKALERTIKDLREKRANDRLIM